MEIAILDKHGNPQSEDWLKEMFGPVHIHRFEDQPAYRIVELRETDENVETVITVLDGQGGPVPGLTVVFRRADGTASQKAQTDASGQARFELERDARYSPPEEGPYLTLIRKAEADGDAVFGLGLVRRANKRHLNAVFQWMDQPVEPPEKPVEPPVEPPPTENWAQLLGKLDRIIELLEQSIE